MICSGRRSSWTSASRGVLAGLVWLALLAAWPGLSRSQSDTLELRPADREQFTVEPREAVAITFIVRNGTGRRIDAEPSLTLPPGWRAITPDLPFELAEQESAVRLTSFMVPENAATGDYTVTYNVRDRQRPGVSAAYAARVHVVPEVKVQVLSVESPDFAIAGERYRSGFLVRNLGNSPIVAQFKVRSAQGAEAAPRAGTVQLDPGEAKPIVIESTAPKVRRRTAEQLTLALEVVDTPIHESAAGTTQIVPRVSPDDTWHTLSARVGVDFVGSDAEGQRASGWQPTLSGAGSLDEDNRRHLSFSLRGPDARDRGSLGVADEYWVRYSQGTMTATLGDDTYGLSMLTEPGRYGSGGLFGFQRSRWGLSTYHMRDRLGGSGTEQSGLNTYYWLSRDTRVDVNLLDKQGGELAGTIESLRSETRWAPWLSTDFEAAQSDGDRERGRAYRGSLQGSAHGLRYYALGWRADPGYRGYLRDKKYVSAGFDLPRRQGWGLRGYYRLQDWNLEEPEDLPLDPRRAPNLQDLIRFAPTEQQASLGTEHSLGRATRFTLDYNLRKRADGHSTPQLDLMSRSVRAGLGRSWKSLSFLYSIERGITRDEILARQFDTTFHMLSGSWRASPTQTYGFYGFRDENARANEPQPPQTTFGVSANYVIGVATSLSLNAQQNDTQTRRGGQYNVALRHERPDGGRFTLIGRRIKGRITQTDVMLTYSAPFGLPVARKADVGSLGGRVYDSETGAGLRSVLLNLDGLTAVTDDNGNFTFPVVKANTYRLSMDRANVAVDKVPVESFPLDVSITAHELRQVQVALIRTVTISVTVKQRVSSTNGINGVPETSPEAVHGVQNALVTLSRGDIVYRRLTDAEGRVKLGGLPPGTWTVTLAGEGIPAGYTSAAREQQLEVPPGTAAATEFELTPIRRDIRMLPPLQVHR